jgi:hypothetical protein
VQTTPLVCASAMQELTGPILSTGLRWQIPCS